MTRAERERVEWNLAATHKAAWRLWTAAGLAGDEGLALDAQGLVAWLGSVQEQYLGKRSTGRRRGSCPVPSEPPVDSLSYRAYPSDTPRV